jgi:hypothetical protein
MQEIVKQMQFTENELDRIQEIINQSASIATFNIRTMGSRALVPSDYIYKIYRALGKEITEGHPDYELSQRLRYLEQEINYQ